MNTQLDQGAGQALGRLIEAKGFTVHGGVFPSEVLSDDDGQVTGVLMADGRTVDADLVIVAIGVKPRRGGRGIDPGGRRRRTDAAAAAGRPDPAPGPRLAPILAPATLRQIERDARALPLMERAGEAAAPPVPDQEVGETTPVLAWHELDEVALDLDRIPPAGQPEPLRDAPHVRVDHDPLGVTELGREHLGASRARILVVAAVRGSWHRGRSRSACPRR